MAISHNEIGLIQEELGYLDNAIYHLERAIEILIELNETKKLVQVYNNLANIYFILKELEISYEYYEKAITLTREKNLFAEEIKTSSNLVDVLFVLKNFERVKDILRQNSIYFRQAGDIFGIINTLIKYGQLYFYLGEDHYKKSIKSLENALDLIKRYETKIPISYKAQMKWECYLYLGKLELHFENYTRAEDWLLKSLEAIRTHEIKESINQGVILEQLGELSKSRGDYKKAIEFYNLSGKIYYKFGNDFENAKLKTIIAQLYLDYLNDDMEAIRYLEEALEVFENKNYEKECGDILHKLGDISIAQGMIDLAISNFQRAQFYYREIQDEYHVNLMTEKLNSLMPPNDHDF